ncbi:hypothetical protein [Kineococcus auxinigenes]|uniref:hypothetical protein n=1 Tax=unclassified Kineococcus TaxID=2621656 RepID=UPI003D7CD41E
MNPVAPVVVRLPPDPTGTALAEVVRELRTAVRSGDVVVDTSAVRNSSPGLRRALARLESSARRAGARWRYETDAGPEGAVGVRRRAVRESRSR